METLITIIVILLIVPFLVACVGLFVCAAVFVLGVLAMPFVWLWACFMAVQEKS